MASRDHCVVRKPVSGNTVSAKTAGNQASKKNKSYKSAHSIGSRKATEKVITYNETLPFFPEMVQQFWSGKNSMDSKKRSASKKRHAASPASDAVTEKRAKRDVKAQVVTAKKVAKSATDATKAGCLLLMIAGKKNENSVPESNTPKNDGNRNTGNSAKVGARKSAGVSGRKEKDLPGKDKRTQADVGNRNKLAPDKKSGKEEKSGVSKKTTKPRKEKEIPSLKSFLKPKREASLFASAMVNILFEKVPSPKKDNRSGDKSKRPSSKALVQTPKSSHRNDAEEGNSLASKVKKKAMDSKKLPLSAKFGVPKCKKAGGKKANCCEAEKVVKRKAKTRMASLNARALIAAERESLKLALERAARTDRYCVSWKHKSPAERSAGVHAETARWVEGRGDTCCMDATMTPVPGVCVASKKDLSASTNPVGPVSSPAPAHHVTEVTNAMGAVHLGLAPGAREKEVVAEDRPSSVVDVVGAHTPSKAPVLSASSCLNSYGGLFPHSAPCLSPCPGYSYSHTEGYVTTSGYQSFTLSGIGTLGVPVVTPTYRTSAFSVPYNASLPYGYYPGGYYQPAAAGPLLPQPIAQTCLLAHHIPVRVPHAQVKVLIHNPDTPHDLAAFSERTYTGKSSDSNNNSSSVNNDIGNISNKNNGSVRGNSASKCSGTDVNIITSGSSNSKKRTSADNSKSKNVSVKKNAESRVELKNRDVEKACKRKYEKRKAKVTKTEDEVREEKKEVKREEPEVPDHGWSWIGEPDVKKIPTVNVDMPPVERRCYRAIKHMDGDVIFSRDCVLLRSGSRKSDVPYVAKVAAFWEHPESGEMMMSLLWYYQPEHTEAGRQAHDLESEVFASRHWDENSVACIDDKCYVLTYDQYCRYQGEMRRHEDNALPRSKVVPILEMFEGSQYNRELPDHDVDPENVFMCRKVYDFRQKRILKNPS